MMSTCECQFNGLQVAVVEDQPPTRDGLVNLLKRLGCQVVWVARTEEDARTLTDQDSPHILFVDLVLNTYDSYESGWRLVKHLRVRNPDLRIILWSSSPVIDDIILEAIQLGCSYVIKQDMWGCDETVIASAMQAALSGSVMLTKEVVGRVRMLIDIQQDSILTRREKSVLSLIHQGMSNDQIARALYISKNTVKTHIQNIYSKLDVNSRVQATRWYQERFATENNDDDDDDDDDDNDEM
jgi:DNA-binding NarL/FixJ family response regulator